MGTLSNLPQPERPRRSAIEAIAPVLIDRFGAQILSTARCYSQTPEDAEDAYQRGLEILLTKAPTTDVEVLVPWLKTVVKHEAFALRKQRERQGVAAVQDEGNPTSVDTHEHVERLDKLKRGAEALGRLKAHETRCMLLLAEGHSYAEICELTGFSYTKVNRCLTEGRRSFLERVERIESGAECERFLPLLSALADGEASARDMAMLRPHLRTCLTCRAALRDAREVPARVAALAPVGLIAAASHGGIGASFAGPVRAAAEWLNDRVTSMVLRGQDALEAASTHKLAAAAASAAALGGGGVATVEMASSHPARHRSPAHVMAARPGPTPSWRPVANMRTGTAPPERARHEHPRTRRAPRRSLAPHLASHPVAKQVASSMPPIGPAAVRPASVHTDAATPATPTARTQQHQTRSGTTGEFGP